MQRKAVKNSLETFLTDFIYCHDFFYVHMIIYTVCFSNTMNTLTGLANTADPGQAQDIAELQADVDALETDVDGKVDNPSLVEFESHSFAVTNANPAKRIKLTENNIDLADNKIINVTDPTDAQDAATKNYVDPTIENVKNITSHPSDTSGETYVDGTLSCGVNCDAQINRNTFSGGDGCYSGGDESITYGNNCSVNSGGVQSIAFGLDHNLTSAQSVALGANTNVTDANSFVFGNSTTTQTTSSGVGTATFGGVIHAPSVNLTDQVVFDISNISGNFIARTTPLGITPNYGDTDLVIGQDAGEELTSSASIFIGNQAGQFLNSASNVCVGVLAGQGVTTSSTGLGNTFVGRESGKRIRTGATNSCFGYLSGDSITTGNNNICIGNQSDVSATDDNQIAIGYLASATIPNTCVIGGVGVNALTSINPGTNACNLGEETAFNDLHIDGDIIKNGVSYGVFGLFSQMADKSVVGGTPGDLFNTTNARGGLVAPPNTLVQGSTNHLRMSGVFSTNGNGQTVRLDTKTGSTVVATTGDISLQNISGVDSGTWTLDVTFAVRTAGIATVASMQTTGNFAWSDNSGTNTYIQPIDVFENTTLDTTVSNTFSVLCTWTDTSTNNIMLCHNAVVTKIF